MVAGVGSLGVMGWSEPATDAAAGVPTTVLMEEVEALDMSQRFHAYQGRVPLPVPPSRVGAGGGIGALRGYPRWLGPPTRSACTP